ncbi:hypothetical protein Kpho01_73850 [Kitasatospora phosalacinea]|uniref:Guanylate cyclase domain-containing protein n=1 Tax=Kitasatospora phosalacinea TaxID=2065 RepID=A0A9W6PN79_9ACTN|nr:hypothetical protein Kpho01_73850 [Kitasatospora phosalacinea]
MVIDMKGYSRLPEVQMAVVRSDLDSVLETAFVQSGLPAPRSLGDGYKDTGDGAILVLPPEHAARLVDPLLGNLSAALQRYEGVRMASAPPLRLRAAVHVGPLSVPDHRGAAINDACRLADSAVVRHAVDAAVDNGLFLAAVLSEPVYQRSVPAGRTRPELTERQFLAAEARVADKPDFGQSCRLFVPGLPAGALRRYLPEPADPASPAPAPPSAPEHAVPDRPSRAGATFTFHSELRDSVVADHIDTLRMR